MTEGERDSIDKEATLFAKACSQRIDTLVAALRAQGVGDDIRAGSAAAYHKSLTAFLYDRLESLTRMMRAQRATRFRQALSVASTLSVFARSAGGAGASTSSAASAHGSPAPVAAGATSGGGGGGGGTVQRKSDGSSVAASARQGAGGLASDDASAGASAAAAADDADAGLTPELRAALEAENGALVAQLQNDLDEARTLESKMLEISELLTLFSEKVAEQHETVEALYEDAQTSHEYLVKSTEQLRSAAAHGVDFRLFVMLFLIIASFSLLFLEWFS